MTRIVVWNVRKAAQRKLPRLLELRPDVAIVPECAADLALPEGSTMAWCGADRTCGLAVLGLNGYEVARVGDEMPDEVWCMPVSVMGPHAFSLLAVWSDNSREARAQEGPTPMGPLRRALRTHERFVRSGDVVVAGDFNNHPRWDKPLYSANSSYEITDLGSLGLVSAYHRFEGVDFGKENDATYFQAKQSNRPYHIDYCFVPSTAHVSSVEVGRWEQWCQPKIGPSDHAPLTVSLDW